MKERITTPFGAQSTADEVIEGVSLAGRRAIVTEGADGLGRETARALASAGAAVTVAARNLDAANTATQEIRAATGNADVHGAQIDLGDLASVSDLVKNWTGPLHILVINSGITATAERHTPEERELPFAINHLGHSLAVGLHDALASADSARVVAVSSVGHVNGPVCFDFTRVPYDPWLAYAQFKTANILFAVEAAKRWAADGIAVNAVNAGRIRGTGHGRYIGTPSASFDPSGKIGVSEKIITQGAATSTLLAASPLVEGVTGKYFEECQEAVPFTPVVRRGAASYATDPGQRPPAVGRVRAANGSRQVTRDLSSTHCASSGSSR
jgi:NAD(P)-dependent dehydrogenase (short-subunit alcohol dehydrogenase family)